MRKAERGRAKVDMGKLDGGGGGDGNEVGVDGHAARKDSARLSLLQTSQVELEYNFRL